jgi:hypothetical protein
VAPLLARECVGCHVRGGAAPFGLDTYELAARRARAIVSAVEAGAMPPWMPDARPGTFVGQPEVSRSDLTMLRRWAEAGAPRGSAEPPPAGPDGWSADEPDLVVPFPIVRAPADGPDLYPSVVATIPELGERWIRRAEVRPGTSGAVHHLFVRVDTTSSSRELAARDDSSGFDRLEGGGNAVAPGGDFLGWAPGQRNLPSVEGVAWRLPAGADVVVDLHLRPTGREADVAVEIAFYFSDRPPAVEPLVIGLMADEIDIPAGAVDYLVYDTLTLPVDVEVLSIYPHAHFLGRSLEGLATLPGGETLSLIQIPDWDFNWQGAYQFVEPVKLPAGTVIEQRFKYDNTADNPRNPFDPPQRTVMGRASTDEMAELTLRVMPRTEADRRVLAAAFGRRLQARTLIRVARLRLAEGKQRFADGDLERARLLFQEAIRFRPDSVEALVWLSRTFLAGGDIPSALLVARQAMAVSGGADPEAAGALAAAVAAEGSR